MSRMKIYELKFSCRFFEILYPCYYIVRFIIFAIHCCYFLRSLLKFAPRKSDVNIYPFVYAQMDGVNYVWCGMFPDA